MKNKALNQLMDRPNIKLKRTKFNQKIKCCQVNLSTQNFDIMTDKPLQPPPDAFGGGGGGGGGGAGFGLHGGTKCK